MIGQLSNVQSIVVWVRSCASVIALAFAFVAGLAAWPAVAQNAKIALAASLTGVGSIYGTSVVNAAHLAVEDSDAAGGPRIELSVSDDQSTDEGARKIARQIVGSDALVVVGPALTTSSLAAGPLYAADGLGRVVNYLDLYT
jgi:ABC-type branched-subunit amino acid transport system substrate-binding protein